MMPEREMFVLATKTTRTRTTGWALLRAAALTSLCLRVPSCLACWPYFSLQASPLYLVHNNVPCVVVCLACSIWPVGHPNCLRAIFSDVLAYVVCGPGGPRFLDDIHCVSLYYTMMHTRVMVPKCKYTTLCPNQCPTGSVLEGEGVRRPIPLVTLPQHNTRTSANNEHAHLCPR